MQAILHDLRGCLLRVGSNFNLPQQAAPNLRCITMNLSVHAAQAPFFEISEK